MAGALAVAAATVTWLAKLALTEQCGSGSPTYGFVRCRGYPHRGSETRLRYAASISEAAAVHPIELYRGVSRGRRRGATSVGIARPSSDRGVRQRRFWDHLCHDEGDLGRHVEYVHFNTVRQGLVSCPREWPRSSLHRWGEDGRKRHDWCCVCDRPTPTVPDFASANADMAFVGRETPRS